MLMIRKLMLALGTAMFAHSAIAGLLMKPTADPDLVYEGQILEGNYAESISNPEVFLGFEAGQRVADPAQISAAIAAWQGQSDRLKGYRICPHSRGQTAVCCFHFVSRKSSQAR